MRRATLEQYVEALEAAVRDAAVREAKQEAMLLAQDAQLQQLQAQLAKLQAPAGAE